MKTRREIEDARMADMPHLMTIDEVAKFLKLTRRGVESITKRGVLPVIKLSNRAIRYNKKALIHVLEKMTVPANEV